MNHNVFFITFLLQLSLLSKHLNSNITVEKLVDINDNFLLDQRHDNSTHLNPHLHRNINYFIINLYYLFLSNINYSLNFNIVNLPFNYLLVNRNLYILHLQNYFYSFIRYYYFKGFIHTYPNFQYEEFYQLDFDFVKELEFP